MWKLNARPDQPVSSTRIRRVLVVDDDVELCHILCRAINIADRSIEIDVANSAGSAREMLERARYDLILLDNFLDAEARGVDLVRPSRERQPGSVVALMSSMERSALAALASSQHDLPILPKPFSPMLFHHLLRESLDLAIPYRGNIAPLR